MVSGIRSPFSVARTMTNCPGRAARATRSAAIFIWKMFSASLRFSTILNIFLVLGVFYKLVNIFSLSWVDSILAAFELISSSISSLLSYNARIAPYVRGEISVRNTLQNHLNLIYRTHLFRYQSIIALTLMLCIGLTGSFVIMRRRSEYNPSVAVIRSV